MRRLLKIPPSLPSPARLAGLARRGGLIPCCKPSLAGPSRLRSDTARTLHASQCASAVAAPAPAPAPAVARARAHVPSNRRDDEDWMAAAVASQEVQTFDEAQSDLDIFNDASTIQSWDNINPPDHHEVDDETINSLFKEAGFYLPEEQDLPSLPIVPHDIQHRISKPPLPVDLPPNEHTYSRGYWHRRKADSKSRKHRRNLAPLEVLEPGDRYFNELHAYKRHFEPLMEAVQLEEIKAWEERLQEWSSERLTREGYALNELAGTWVGTEKKGQRHLASFNKVGKAATHDFDWNRLEPGSSVVISRTHPLVDAIGASGEIMKRDVNPDDDNPVIAREDYLQGIVRKRSRGKILLAFDCQFDLGEEAGMTWRFDLAPNDVVHRRTMAAIQSLHLNPLKQDMTEFINDPILPEPIIKRQIEQTVLNGTTLRDVLFRSFQDIDTTQQEPEQGRASPTDVLPSDIDATPLPPKRVSRHVGGAFAAHPKIASWARRYREPNPVRLKDDPPLNLNPSQMRAIALMLGERMSLIQGPPGTGKTRTIIETIKLLKSHWKVPHPILVTAFTNVAVDNLLDGLSKHGLNAVRVGDASVVREDLAHLTLESRKILHPITAEIDAIKARVQEGRRDAEDPNKTKEERQTLQSDLERQWRKTYGMEITMNTAILRDADVICTTCISSVTRDLQAIDFPIVFLDEASMATEPGSLIPLTKGACHVAIIGDHKQLPPVITSEVAQAGGLGTSLFERLIEEHDVPSIMLDTQYRMHPSISAFPNTAFYQGMLHDGTVDRNGKIAPRFEPPRTAFLLERNGVRQNLTFLDQDHPESPMNKSMCNHREAILVSDIVADLLYSNPTLKGSDIGVIAPYVRQISLIDYTLNLDAKRQPAFEQLLGDRSTEVRDVEIKTVDGFEGREKQVIIFSTVRSNDFGSIGFLADWRRLNVGLTRAQRALIMIGNSQTLSRARPPPKGSSYPAGGAKIWKDFIQHLKDRNLIMSL